MSETEITPDQIKVGQKIEIRLPGMEIWNLPAQVFGASPTADTIELLREYAEDMVQNGGGTVYVIDN